jgi:hypothetical protein
MSRTLIELSQASFREWRIYLYTTVNSLIGSLFVDPIDP